MNAIHGSCHCGNIQYDFLRPDFEPTSDQNLPVRACTCSFCIKHGGLYTSHPEGALTVQIAEETQVQHYQFGTCTAKFYICQKCGVFPFVTSIIEENVYAVVNVNTFDNVKRTAFVSALADFEGESTETRLARRQRTWISTVQI